MTAPRAVIAACFLLAACGGEEPTEPRPEPPTAAPATPEPAASPAPTPAVTPDVVETGAPVNGACVDGRTVQNSWQGEYPGPIIHIQKESKLPTRSAPCLAKADGSCKVKPGLYHPWSKSTVKAPEGLGPFVTVRPVDRWVFTRAHQWAMDTDTPKTSAPGDVLEVLFYSGEGYCEVRFEGKNDSEQCPELWGAGILERQGEEHTAEDETQLFYAACAGGGHRWIEGSQSLFVEPHVAEGELIEYGRVGPAGGGDCETVALQGRNGTFEAAGRPVESLAIPNKNYKKLISKEIGEEAALEQLWKVDLQGDGTDEVLFEAKGRKSGAPAVGVRGLVNGAVVTALLDGSMNKGDPSLRLHGVADVDGDGTLEVVTSRKGQLAAFQIQGPRTAPADDERCGW